MSEPIRPIVTGGGQSSAPEPRASGSGAPEAPALPRQDRVEISIAAQAALQQAVQQQISAPKAEASAKPQGDLQIRFNRDLGVLQAKVVDPMTRQVILEIPPDDVLRMATHIRTFFRERGRRVASSAGSSRTGTGT